MTTYGLLVDYEYCSGCKSCEVACRNELGFGIEGGVSGIEVLEQGPHEYSATEWDWNYRPALTKRCDLCASRTAQGRDAACVHHCLAQCLELGPIEDLAKKAAEKGSLVYIEIPKQ